ncbi:hypothetical protein C8R43DRAFT_1120744 [Mycena crocata]|nr:hypothetical protein C8R43DRAFT_1120744 [Mycena crocata]
MSDKSSSPETAAAAQDGSAVALAAADDKTKATTGSSAGSGTLQLGERYHNMDYSFTQSMGGHEQLPLIVSYDIALCGSTLKAPGVYGSWLSAQAEWKSVPAHDNATCKGFFSQSKLRSAWHARCDRGEHNHPVDPAIVAQSRPVPLYFISSRSPSPARDPPPYGSPPPASPPASPPVSQSSPARPHRPRPAPGSIPSSPSTMRNARAAVAPPPAAPASPSPPSRARGRVGSRSSTGPTPPVGLKSYAVRVGHEGEIFTDAGEARQRFLALQEQGKSPSLVSSDSVARCMAWLDNTPWEAAGSTQLRGWAEEEERARRRRVAAQRQQEAQRVAILAALDIERAEDECSDGEESAAESDVSRSTADLQNELNVRSARTAWRRLPS